MYEELKKLSKHYTIYAAGSIISKAIGFIMIPVYTRYITPAEYGVLGILNLFVWIISLVIGMNITAGVTRFYFYYKDKNERNSVVSTSLFFTIFFAMLVTTCLFFSASALSRLLFRTADYTLYLRLAFLSVFFELLMPLPFACFRIKNMSFRFLQLSLLELLTGLVLNILFIVFLKWGILGILYSQIITPLVISPILLYLTIREFGFSFSLDPLKRILTYTLPLVPAGLAMIVLNLGDRYILKYFVSLEQVGIYTLGYKVVMVLGFLVGGPFRYVWQPYRFSIAESKNAATIHSLVFTYFTLLITFVGLGLAILADEMIKIIAAPPYYAAANVIPLVTAGYIFYQLYYFLNIGMYLKHETIWVPFVVSAAAAVNVITNILLIPKMGIIAAAFATFVSFAFLAVAGYTISQKFCRISYEFGRLGKIALVALGLYFTSGAISIKVLWQSFFLKSLLILSFPLVLYLLGFYTRNEITGIFRLIKDTKVKVSAISLKVGSMLNGEYAD